MPKKKKPKVGKLPLSGDREKPSTSLRVKITFLNKKVQQYVSKHKNISKYFRDLAEKDYDKSIKDKN